MARSLAAFALALAVGWLHVGPAAAVDGVVLITQATALNGNVTPGDTAGFPVTISVPGSYRLAGNLKVPAGKNGIAVTATEVSIDLNGFTIDGGGVASIGVDGTQRSLTLRNGTIRAFNVGGVYSRGALLLVQDMRIEENFAGIYNDTNGLARIVNNTVFGSKYFGISCAQSCHVEGNIISYNGSGPSGGHGLLIDSGTVLGNTIIGNGGFGIVGTNKTGFGNNTIADNASGQVWGGLTKLFPNACSPTAC